MKDKKQLYLLRKALFYYRLYKYIPSLGRILKTDEGFCLYFSSVNKYGINIDIPYSLRKEYFEDRRHRGGIFWFKPGIKGVNQRIDLLKKAIIQLKKV